MAAWERRIEQILGDDVGRSRDTAERYRTYLKGFLSLPLEVTGREDFPWEEPYVFGGWSQKEYVSLKKSKPSYKDVFDLIDILPADEHADVTAQIKRHSDGKLFTIGLSWLTTAATVGPYCEVLNDYATWHANH